MSVHIANVSSAQIPFGWHGSAVVPSADGSKLVAGGWVIGGDAGSLPAPILVSTDSGATWSATTSPNYVWVSVASSADGHNLVAVSVPDNWGNSGVIYRWGDAGVTWAQAAAPNNGWSAIASSADGTRLVAVSRSDGDIYTSVDLGTTWTPASAPSNFYSSIASSADGSKLIAGAISGGGFGSILISTNSGSTRIQTAAPSNECISVASSADGSKLIAATLHGYIAISTNFGMAWIIAKIINNDYTCTSVASSADGGRIVAAGPNGGIPYSLALPAIPPLLALGVGTSPGKLEISWLIPSTSFVLQQNSDLSTTNWTDVPATPSINFTNLHYELMVLPTKGEDFYRLKQQ